MAGQLPHGDTHLTGSREIEPGDLSFPGYEVERLLGAGGMGAVYQVRQRDTGALRALKTLKVEAASIEARQRFQVEIESLGALDHSNIVRVHAADLNARRPFVVMEMVEGVELSDVIDEPWEADRAAVFVEKVLRALACVHGRGVIHRDLKPQNIFLCEGDEPKLADFGLARIREGEGLTQTGDVLGTPAFMAPEQILGLSGTIGPAVDIWAVGVILFRLVTGQLPFNGTNAMGMMSDIVTGQAPLMSSVSAEIDIDLEEIVARALSHDADKRYPSAEAMADDLALFLDGETPEARKRTRRFERRGIVIGGLLVALAFIALSLWFGDSARRTRAAETLAGGPAALTELDQTLRAAPLLAAESAEGRRAEGRRVLDLLGRSAERVAAIAEAQAEAEDAAADDPKVAALATMLERWRAVRAGLTRSADWPAADQSAERVLAAKALLARACVAVDGQETTRSLTAAVAALAPWMASGEEDPAGPCGLAFLANPQRDPLAARRFLALFGSSLEAPGRFRAVFAALPEDSRAGFAAYLGRCYGIADDRPADLPWIIDNCRRLAKVGAFDKRPGFLAKLTAAAAEELLKAPPLELQGLARDLTASFGSHGDGPGLLKGRHPWLAPGPRQELLTALTKLERVLSAGATALSEEQRGALSELLREPIAYGVLHGALWYRPALFDKLARTIDGSGLAVKLFAPASYTRLSAGPDDGPPPDPPRIDRELAELEAVTQRAFRGDSRKNKAEQRQRQRVQVQWNRKAAALLAAAWTVVGPGEARRILAWWRLRAVGFQTEDIRRRAADTGRVFLTKDHKAFMEYAWLRLRLPELARPEREDRLAELRDDISSDELGLVTLLEARDALARGAPPEPAALERWLSESRSLLKANHCTEFLAEWLELRAILAELMLEAGAKEEAAKVAAGARAILENMEAEPARALRRRLESAFPKLNEKAESGHDDGG